MDRSWIFMAWSSVAEQERLAFCERNGMKILKTRPFAGRKARSLAPPIAEHAGDPAQAAEKADEVWTRFKGGREGALWYYRSLVTAFRAHGRSALIDELDRVVSEMERLS
jgi:hypothetical protein